MVGYWVWRGFYHLKAVRGRARSARLLQKWAVILVDVILQRPACIMLLSTICVQLSLLSLAMSTCLDVLKNWLELEL